MSKVVMKGDNLEEEHLRCPSCDLPIKRERDVSEETKAVSAASQFDDDDGDGDGEGLDEEDFCSSGPEESSSDVGRAWQRQEEEAEAAAGSAPSSLEEMKKEYDLTRRRREDVSAKMGEKMLAGWTMLALTCPRPDCAGTPLMRARGPEPRTVLCVSCESTSFDQDKDRDRDQQGKGGASRSPNPVQNSGSAAAALADPSPSPSSERRWETEPLPPRLPPPPRHSSSDPSVLISEKLLKGWALLDAVCACSSTPLMRDRAGQLHCVSCGEVDGKGQVTLPAPQQKEAAAPARRNSSSPARVAVQEEEEEEDLEASTSSSSSVPAGRRPREQRAPTQPGSPVALDGFGSGSVEDVLATLFKKLRWAAAALEESESVAESVEMARLVRAVAEAVPAVTAAGLHAPKHRHRSGSGSGGRDSSS